MARNLAFAVLIFSLSGCVALSTVAAVPTAVVDGIFYMLRGKKLSLGYGIDRVLAATQRGLNDMDLPVDVLEPAEDGYEIVFGGENMEGWLSLRRDTGRLTTIHVKIIKGIGRLESIEEAVLATISKKTAALPDTANFNFSDYNPVRKRPKEESDVIAWYRRGASARFIRAGEKWLRIGLPSKNTGYIHSRLRAKPKG